MSYDGWTYTWEDGRQLKSLSNASTSLSFKYNSDGIRTEKTVNGVTTKYTVFGDKVSFETTGSDKIHYSYDASGNLFSMNLNGSEYYYTRNAQGDITGLIDNAGNLVVSYTYDTWGKLLSTTGSLASTLGVKNPYRYRGYRYDTESGLYYLQSRYYNPEWGRFVNADDIGVITASMVDITDKNLFTYCDNNPIIRIDNGGNLWMIIGTLAGAAIGGIAGAAISYAITGRVSWWAVAGGAASGALIGLGAGYLAGKAVMASSWAQVAAGGTSSAVIGRNFEKWYYQFNNISKSMQQVLVRGIGRLDVVSKGKIIELKNYDWSKYKYLSSVVSSFTEQGQRYMQLIGQKVNGQTIKSVEFFFSSKPPQQILRALQDIGIRVNWIK